MNICVTLGDVSFLSTCRRCSRGVILLLCSRGTQKCGEMWARDFFNNFSAVVVNHKKVTQLWISLVSEVAVVWYSWTLSDVFSVETLGKRKCFGQICVTVVVSCGFPPFLAVTRICGPQPCGQPHHTGVDSCLSGVASIRKHTSCFSQCKSRTKKALVACCFL